MQIKILASALALGLAAPLAAAGTMTADQVGMAPMAGQSASDYVMKAADGDMYEVQSSQVALEKSQDRMVRQHAQQMIRDHGKTTASLKAAAAKARPPQTPPASPTPETQAKIDMLRNASAGDFDRMYWDGQKQGHQQAWAVHKGYSQDGGDAALKAAASKTVPIVEGHLKHLNSMNK